MTKRHFRIMFYVQHLLGIGHLARASRIAQALVGAGHAVTMVTGGKPVAGFPGPGVDHVALPPVSAANTGYIGLAGPDGLPVDAAFMEGRAGLLLQAYRDLKPDVVLIEQFPFGRRQMRFELIPLLDAIHATPDRPRVLASVRDILQQRPKPERDVESVEHVRRYFDHVLVHGDPAFVRLEETFPLAHEILDKVIYTGLVAAPPPQPVADRFDIVVSAGGGAVGAEVVRVALGAAALLPGAGSWCVITGPNLPQPAFDAFAASAPPGVAVVRFRTDFASLLGAARLSVSQAGYNTVCDILRAGCASIVVPFTAGGETEQAVRAERLGALGRVQVLTEAELSPAALADRIAAALQAPPPSPHGLDIEGAAHMDGILQSLL